MKFISNTNRIGAWVITEILIDPGLDVLVQKLIFFIRLGEELLTRRNYSSLVHIVSALESPAVDNLKTALSRIPSRLLKVKEKLSELMTPLSRYKNYKVGALTLPSFTLTRLRIPSVPCLIRTFVCLWCRVCAAN